MGLRACARVPSELSEPNKVCGVPLFIRLCLPVKVLSFWGLDLAKSLFLFGFLGGSVFGFALRLFYSVSFIQALVFLLLLGIRSTRKRLCSFCYTWGSLPFRVKDPRWFGMRTRDCKWDWGKFCFLPLFSFRFCKFSGALFENTFSFFAC